MLRRGDINRSRNYTNWRMKREFTIGHNTSWYYASGLELAFGIIALNVPWKWPFFNFKGARNHTGFRLYRFLSLKLLSHPTNEDRPLESIATKVFDIFFERFHEELPIDRRLPIVQDCYEDEKSVKSFFNNTGLSSKDIQKVARSSIETCKCSLLVSTSFFLLLGLVQIFIALVLSCFISRKSHKWTGFKEFGISPNIRENRKMRQNA